MKFKVGDLVNRTDGNCFQNGNSITKVISWNDFNGKTNYMYKVGTRPRGQLWDIPGDERCIFDEEELEIVE